MTDTPIYRRRRRDRRLVATFALAALLASPALATAPAQLVVIVPRGSGMSNATAEELRNLYLGSSTVLSDKRRVILVECAPLKSRFYKTLLRMNETQVKRHWIQLVFAGDFATPPVEFADDAAVKRYVATHPGAIGFISASEVDETVKALRVDGLAPLSPDYLFRTANIAIPQSAPFPLRE